MNAKLRDSYAIIRSTLFMTQPAIHARGTSGATTPLQIGVSAKEVMSGKFIANTPRFNSTKYRKYRDKMTKLAEV
jgi:hypothetical protein